MSEISTVLASTPSLDQVAPTALTHRRELDHWATGHQGNVLPDDVANTIRTELAAVINRGSPKQIAVHFGAKLLGAYPARASDNQDDLRVYAGLVMEELQRFSPEILARALPAFWRSHPFRPSVGEISIALETEVERFRRLRHGLERMERRRAAVDAERIAVEVRAEESRARAAAADNAAVRQFGADGVQPGDYAGAMRTFQLIEPIRRSAPSPWLQWVRLLPTGQEWPKWLALPMRRAGIFGRAQLGLARGQATIDELSTVQKHLIGGDEKAACDLAVKIEQRPVDPAKAIVDPERIGAVPAEVTVLAEAFRGLLTEPAAPPEEVTP